MSIFRSRDYPSNFMSKNSFNSMTYRNELNLTTFRVAQKKKNFKKKSIDQSKYDGEIKKIMQHNKFLKDQISLLSMKNTNIKNFMKQIITSNNNKMNKKDISTFIKEYNEQVLFNNKKVKLDVDKDLNIYKNIENDMNNRISDLLATKEEKEKTKFLLENDHQRKDNFIQIYSTCFKNIGSVQEAERFRYLNDEIYPNDIDNYFSKYLDIYRKNLLQTTQKWNKFKNKANRDKKEIEELKKILRNPKELKKNKNIEEQKNSFEINTTEGDNDIFLLTFDEFEDDYEPGLNEQDSILYEDPINNEKDTENNNNKIPSINLKNMIGKEATFTKINNRNSRKINNLNNIDNNNNINNRTGNKITFAKKDMYYFPQNNYSRSIIRDKTDSPRINSNRTGNITINSISKLNFKQILFNKNAKYIKEEANDLAIKRFEIENEFELSKNDYGNRDEMKIKDLKRDIKIFKGKIKKKRKIIKEFQKFCNEFYIKYQRYMNSNYNEI